MSYIECIAFFYK